MRSRTAAFLALAVLAASIAASTAHAGEWRERRDAALRYLETRAGVESFAFVDDRGRMHGYWRNRVVPSASLLKAILLVAYLNRSSVRNRALNDYDRSLLKPMIRRSDNTTATRVLWIVGASGVYRVARRADMERFRLRSPWGLSEVTAREQAGFFYRIDRLVPQRHRRFTLRVLRRIVASQRWGIPPVKPPNWTIHFKGGWGSGTGAVTHQSALLRHHGKRIAISILTTSNPSHSYGTRTIRGIARRILRTPLPLARG